MSKILTAIGLMSGTSLDGIDASIIQSDGDQELKLIENNYISYDSKTISDIVSLKDKIISFQHINKNIHIIEILEKKITLLHVEAVKKIIEKSNIGIEDIDVIGFHGQTIYHNFKEKISLQLGDGHLLSKEINKKVIYNFRKNDIKNGGQGAPLTPIFHKLLQKKMKLELPVVFVNIGGIANLTYISNKGNILSFDSGPGNCLIDKYVKIKSNNNISLDLNGEIAQKGNCNKVILESFLNDPFYLIEPPKTLDVNDFSLSKIRGLSFEDSVTTLTELTCQSIINSFSNFKEKPKKIILVGGGRKNKYIYDRIKHLTKINTVNIDELNQQGDFIESQAFGYLSIRSFLNKPITYPSTTGVKFPCTGGDLVDIK
jgi:anhydro-N-acetylmuramic acid kinase